MRRIDADALLDEINRIWFDEHHHDTNLIPLAKMIASAPTVEPEIIHKPTSSEFKRMAAQMGYVKREKGKWDSECEPYYTCSACNNTFSIFQKINFCPNCGADMRGEQK